MNKLLISGCLLVVFVVQISGHGMIMDPIGRGSRWRNDARAPKNYDDNANYCGGFWVRFVNESL